MTVSIKLRNKDRYYAALRRTVPGLDMELRAALEKVGNEFVSKAEQYVPVDEGDLKQSIKWDWTKATQDEVGRSPAIVIQAGGEDKNDPGFYARWVEFGTPTTPKQPYFFPAYRLARRGIKSRLSRAMTRAIKRAGFDKK